MKRMRIQVPSRQRPRGQNGPGAFRKELGTQRGKMEGVEVLEVDKPGSQGHGVP